MSGRFTVLFTLVLLCALRTAADNTADCLLPGLDSMQFSIDIVKGPSNSPQNRLFNWTFVDGKTWVSPFDPTLTYCVPDQLHVVNDFGTRMSAGVYYSGAEYAESMAMSFGLKFQTGMFAADTSVTMVQNQVNSAQMAVAEAVELVTVYNVAALYDRVQPGALVQHLENLPGEPYNYEAYATFFNYYGTHALSSGVLGGRGRLAVAMQDEFYSVSSGLQIATNAQLQWNSLKLGFGGGFNKDNTSASFQQYSSALLSEFEGGLPIYKNNISAYEQWVPSVILNPALTSMTLVSLSSFFPDVSDPRIALFERALGDYLSQAPPNNGSVTPGSRMLLHSDCTAGEIVNSLTVCPSSGTAVKGWSHHCGHGDYPAGAPMCCNATSMFAVALQPFSSESRSRREDDTHQWKRVRTVESASAFPPVPGSDSVGVGYDITRGVLRPGPMVTLPMSNQTITDPWSGRSYVYPANVAVTFSRSEGTILRAVYTSASDYAKQLAFAETGSLSAAGQMLLSESVQWASATFSSRQAVLGVWDMLEQWSCMQVQGDLTDFTVTPTFADAVMRLPLEYDADVYREFVVLWGTHAIYQACMGGRATLEAAISVSMDMTSSQSAVQLGLLFAEFQTGSSQASESFTNQTFGAFRVRGGTFESYAGWMSNKDWYDQWLGSVPDAPTQINRKLLPIDQLAGKVDATRASWLKQAVTDYLAEAVAAAAAMGAEVTAALGAQLITAVIQQGSSSGNVTCAEVNESGSVPFAVSLAEYNLGACNGAEGRLPLRCAALQYEVPQPGNAAPATFPVFPCGPTRQAGDGYHMCAPDMVVVGWSSFNHGCGLGGGNCPVPPAKCQAMCY